MNVSPSKEIILKKIRQALTHKVPLPFSGSEGNNSLFHAADQDLAILFAEKFAVLEGRFIFCENDRDALDQLFQLTAVRKWDKLFCKEAVWRKNITERFEGFSFHEEIASCDVSITTCELLVARTGTIVLSAAQTEGRTASVYAPVHICIAYTNQLVYDLKDALQQLKEKYGEQLPSSISFATGPSRTADIEKTLVVGVHGPGEVYVILID
jgi:L-lactate dehydrogenase complex protein LldG